MSEAKHQDEAGGGLFEDLPRADERQAERARQAQAAAKRQGAARLLRPDRSQIELRASDLESPLGEEHRARLVWGCVEQQDLSRLFEAIKARGSCAPRRLRDWPRPARNPPQVPGPRVDTNQARSPSRGGGTCASAPSSRPRSAATTRLPHHN
jgi:hypothetical protein